MECPVCQNTYVKGKVQRCHVCGWELSSSCLSIVGPLRVEHQISMSSLEKIQAWAHYMWNTQQSQKEQVAKLQRQLNNAQQEGERNRIQLEQSRSQQLATNIPYSPPPPYSPHAPNSSVNSSANSSAIPSLERIPAEGREVLEWILQRFTQGEEERSQLQLQFAQLQNNNPPKITGEVEKVSTKTIDPSSQILLPDQIRDIELLRVELQSRISLQLSQFQAVERLKEQFQQQIETVTTEIQQISQERDRLHSQLTEQQKYFDRQQEEWEEIQATLTAKCDRLHSQFTEQQTQLARQQEEWETIQATLTAKCDRLESQLTAQQTQIQQLKTEHGDRLESQLAKQQTQIQQLREENSKLEGAIAERDRVFDAKEQAQRELIENHIQEFNREQKELNSQHTRLSEELRQLRKSWQSHLTQQQMTLQQGSKEGKERQSTLETQQMQLHDQMAKILARCETLESGLENLQLSLRNAPRITSSPAKRANPPVYTKY
ncbi:MULTISPECIES: hypothetical protein [Spirulina sp. CCY15215]|uniref:hypothetical protein n=1 Tax=Spirulina sp. CCY15215 TaxID=2767591 RepID=UPI0019514312|nr:hypothetical protein [Spirulina major]